MASYTENLNLLKKDPVVDGADTFNIETMLNENWDKIDAAKGEIDAALSNKAESNITLCQRTIGDESLNSVYPYPYIALAGPGTFGPRSDFWVVEYYPYGAFAGIQVITSPTGQDHWYRTFIDNTPNVWRKIVTATPPQEYVLPLENGISAQSSCVYGKTQESIVFVRLNFFTSNQLTENMTIAQLPVGFRPGVRVEMEAYNNDGSMCTLKIEPTGSIDVGNGTVPAGKVCWTTVPLFAADC